MYKVEMYLRVRRACMIDGMSIREASREFSLHRDTVRKMLAHSVPPGYRRRKPPRRPKIGPYTGVIDRILEDDPVSSTGQALNLPKKQRYTAKRIHERLRGCFQSLRLVLDLMYETQTIPQRPYRPRVGHSASLTPASQAWRTATYSRYT